MTRPVFKSNLIEGRDPANVNEWKSRSLIPLALKFNNLIPEEDHEKLRFKIKFVYLKQERLRTLKFRYVH